MPNSKSKQRRVRMRRHIRAKKRCKRKKATMRATRVTATKS